MLTTVLVALVALVAFAYVAVPLMLPGQADPLPDDRDPVTQDLEEERDALFRAIRELDARADLPEARREALRARYEAKAAKVLRALDERRAELEGAPRPRPRRRRRAPIGTLALLVLVVVSGAVLPGYLLPRVGDQATATTTDVPTATELKKLQDAARKDPSADTLLALGDAYWSLQQPDQAEATYQQVVDTITPVPAAAYKRLAFLALNQDLDKAAGYLQQALAADPTDPDTLYAVGEVSLAQGDLPRARDAFQRYLATPGNGDDAQAQQRIALIDDVEPLARAAADDPSEANLMALGDAYWQHDEKERAVDVYFRVLTGPDPSNVTALSRTGQLLFLRGRSGDAIGVLQRAAEAAGGVPELDQESLLMLGNAYFSQQQYQDAIDVWTTYVDHAGGPDQAGRVPDLIQSATARMQGLPDPMATTAGLTGQQLFVSTCATCHGAAGQGGSGPTLAGNRRAADAANVEDAIRYGRGLMPGFGAELSDAQVASLVDYVTTVLATQGR